MSCHIIRGPQQASSTGVLRLVIPTNTHNHKPRNSNFRGSPAGVPQTFRRFSAARSFRAPASILRTLATTDTSPDLQNRRHSTNQPTNPSPSQTGLVFFRGRIFGDDSVSANFAPETPKEGRGGGALSRVSAARSKRWNGTHSARTARQTGDNDGRDSGQPRRATARQIARKRKVLPSGYDPAGQINILIQYRERKAGTCHLLESLATTRGNHKR